MNRIFQLTVTSESGDYYEFPVHKWLDKHQDDGRTERQLIPSLSKKNEIAEENHKQVLNTDDGTKQPLGITLNLIVHYHYIF